MAILLEKGENGEIIVRFGYCPELVTTIKTIKGHKWNPEKKYWTVPDSEQTRIDLFQAFYDEQIFVQGFLEDINNASLSTVDLRFERLLTATVEELKLRGYSEKTIIAYRGHITRFLEQVDKEPYEITANDVRVYILISLEKDNKSHSYEIKI